MRFATALFLSVLVCAAQSKLFVTNSEGDNLTVIDARTVKVDQRTLSALYHASLRAELTRSLAVTWHEPANGIAEMTAVQRFPKKTRDVRSACGYTFVAES